MGKRKKMTPEQRAKRFQRNQRRGRDAAMQAVMRAKAELELKTRAAEAGIHIPTKEEQKQVHNQAKDLDEVAAFEKQVGKS